MFLARHPPTDEKTACPITGVGVWRQAGNQSNNGMKCHGGEACITVR